MNFMINSYFNIYISPTIQGGDNGESQDDGAHNLALVRGGVDVILQGKHDRAQSDVIYVKKTTMSRI